MPIPAYVADKLVQTMACINQNDALIEDSVTDMYTNAHEVHVTRTFTIKSALYEGKVLTNLSLMEKYPRGSSKRFDLDGIEDIKVEDSVLTVVTSDGYRMVIDLE